MTGFEKTQLPHTQYQTYDFTRNELLAQYTIIFHCWPWSKATSLVSVAAFLRPYVSLEWHFGTIGWSWLSSIGAWRAGQATKGWPMSVIFNLECCEHKKGDSNQFQKGVSVETLKPTWALHWFLCYEC